MSAVSKLDVYAPPVEMEPHREGLATFSFFFLFKLEQDAEGRRELKQIAASQNLSVGEGITAAKVTRVSSDFKVSIPQTITREEGFVSIAVGAVYSLEPSPEEATLLRLHIVYTNHTAQVSETYRRIAR